MVNNNEIFLVLQKYLNLVRYILVQPPNAENVPFIQYLTKKEKKKKKKALSMYNTRSKGAPPQ